MASDESSESAGRPPSPQSLRDVWLALAGLSAVFLFEMLDNSVLNVALPTIGGDLSASTITLQWVSGVYAIVFGGAMLALSALADQIGRRRFMLIGLVLLGLASLVTGFVANVGQLTVPPWVRRWPTPPAKSRPESASPSPV